MTRFSQGKKKAGPEPAKYGLTRPIGQGQVNRPVTTSFEAPRASKLMFVAPSESSCERRTLLVQAACQTSGPACRPSVPSRETSPKAICQSKLRTRHWAQSGTRWTETEFCHDAKLLRQTGAIRCGSRRERQLASKILTQTINLSHSEIPARRNGL